ncbi:probable plastidic glucose transporter 1 isoform X2 [Zea mays]|uniref:probable plastidic glucose transporter 1 isoform X2 n=1 Tax=Zea mays TaxID=4577 RepID=UPI0009A9ED93|nr:probable plastidic glucose transporter 1 isoform X2 [Zea mays]|eukprot:XP_020396567.1 probable plastidic glucose transporter 1 isoform X2 [Zea mays]
MPTPLAAALLPLPASPALHFPRPRPGPSWRARPAVVRAAALRALPRRLELCPPCLAAVESNPAPPPLAPPPPDEASAGSGLDARAGGGGGGGDGGGGADLGWLRAFPHVFTASMANFLFGYHIGVMNGPIEDIATQLGFQGNPFLQGLVVSIFIVGAFFGSLGSSALVDKFGCKRTLQIDSIPLIIGALLSAQADSLDEMLLGRFLVGIGIGVNTVLVPIYISEVAPTKYRGTLGTLCQIGTCLGIIAALSLGIPSESDPHWWRTMLYAACVPGILIVAGMQFAVESPRWLAKVGRFDDARKVVESLWEPSEVEKSMEEIKAVVLNDDSRGSWSDLLVEPHNRVALIGGSLFFLQQFAGINGVLYFSSLTFRDVGISSGALASLYVGITNFGGALVASNLMDKQGRKKLLIGSYLGMAFAMFLIVYGISFPLDEGVAHSLSIAGTLLYVLSLSILSSKPLRGLGWFGDKGIGGDPWRRKSIAIQNCCSSLAEGLLRTFCGNYTCGFLNVHFYFCNWCWTSYRYHYTRAQQCSDTLKSYGLQFHCALDM